MLIKFQLKTISLYISYEYIFITRKGGGGKMPGGDGTGPMGQGPLTGRGLGPCGRGLGFRRGFGRGWRFWQRTEPVTLSKEEQKNVLEAELTDLEAEKKEIEKKLKELNQ